MDRTAKTGGASIRSFKAHSKKKAKASRKAGKGESQSAPGLKLLDSGGKEIHAKSSLAQAAGLLKDGGLVAVCTGENSAVFCDASSEAAISLLRERTGTPRKPLTLVFTDIEAGRRQLALNSLIEDLLASQPRRAVVLKRAESTTLDNAVSPGLGEQPVMLADGLLRLLLQESSLDAAAMAALSLSRAEDPSGQCARTGNVLQAADLFLLDETDKTVFGGDSLTRLIGQKPLAIRRGRSDSPRILGLPPGLEDGPEIVALGGESDNSVCCIRNADVFLSRQHGDLEDTESFDAFRHSLMDLWKLAGIQLPLLAHEADPVGRSVGHARNLRSVGFVPVQHHFAHVAACMAEHGETAPVLGVVYDSPVDGGDGTFWGAEFLAATPASFRRLGHLRHVRWPGGPQALREPWRIAMSFTTLSYGYQTHDICRDLFPSIPPAKLKIVYNLLEKGLRSPFGSSIGALLDAAGAVAGVCLQKSYHREPALLLESLAERFGGETQAYSYDILDDGNLLLVDPARIFYEAIENMLARRAPQMVAARIFETIAAFTVDACKVLAPRANTDKIVLTGDAFESPALTERTAGALEQAGFRVLTHGVVPPNDGGISVGQAFAARALQTDAFREG